MVNAIQDLMKLSSLPSNRNKQFQPHLHNTDMTHITVGYIYYIPKGLQCALTAITIVALYTNISHNRIKWNSWCTCILFKIDTRSWSNTIHIKVKWTKWLQKGIEHSDSPNETSEQLLNPPKNWHIVPIVRPVMEYAASVWSPHLKGHKEVLEKV